MHRSSGRLGKQSFEVPQQEVDVERSFVGFVQDDRVVLVQESVARRLGQQDAVGHQLHVRFGTGPVGEADLVAHILAQRRAEFFRQSRGNRTCGESSWLRVADHSVHAAAHFQTDFRQLRRFARPGLATHDDHLSGRAPPGAISSPMRGWATIVVSDRGQPACRCCRRADRLLDLVGPSWLQLAIGSRCLRVTCCAASCSRWRSRIPIRLHRLVR